MSDGNTITLDPPPETNNGVSVEESYRDDMLKRAVAHMVASGASYTRYATGSTLVLGSRFETHGLKAGANGEFIEVLDVVLVRRALFCKHGVRCETCPTSDMMGPSYHRCEICKKEQ